MNTRLKNEIINYAASLPNEEVCGFIYYDLLGNSFIKKCDNISKDKYNYFEINPIEFITLNSFQSIYGIFHSHTGDECEFSDSDKSLANEFQMPVFLYNTKNKVWKEFMPKRIKFSLTNNPFSWGLFDCYTLLRFFYWKKYGFLFNDCDRDETFNGITDCAVDKQTIAERLVSEYSFEQVNDLTNGDIILTQNTRLNYSHISVYLDGYVYDHKIGRLSEKTISMIDVDKAKIFRNLSVTKNKV